MDIYDQKQQSRQGTDFHNAPFAENQNEDICEKCNQTKKAYMFYLREAPASTSSYCVFCHAADHVEKEAATTFGLRLKLIQAQAKRGRNLLDLEDVQPRLLPLFGNFFDQWKAAMDEDRHSHKIESDFSEQYEKFAKNWIANHIDPLNHSMAPRPSSLIKRAPIASSRYRSASKNTGGLKRTRSDDESMTVEQPVKRVRTGLRSQTRKNDPDGDSKNIKTEPSEQGKDESQKQAKMAIDTSVLSRLATSAASAGTAIESTSVPRSRVKASGRPSTPGPRAETPYSATARDTDKDHHEKVATATLAPITRISDVSGRLTQLAESLRGKKSEEQVDRFLTSDLLGQSFTEAMEGVELFLDISRELMNTEDNILAKRKSFSKTQS